MTLTEDNYHSTEARQEYFSVSQYKDFIGSVGMRGCEFGALAKISGAWVEEPTKPMLVGSYVDAHFSETLDVFKAQNPEILKKDGTLRAEFIQADEIIQRVERDEYFMKFMAGEKQGIFTGEIFGVQWKGKVDSLDREHYITDLKVMAAIRKAHYTKDYGFMDFCSYWGYDTQGAIYQKLVEINTGKKLPFFIAAASKEKETDLEIIGFMQKDLDDTMSLIEPNINRIIKLKSGEVEPDRCDVCDYCKHTKILSRPIHFSELLLKI